MTRTKETTTMMITVWKVSSRPAYIRKKNIYSTGTYIRKLIAIPMEVLILLIVYMVVGSHNFRFILLQIKDLPVIL